MNNKSLKWDIIGKLKNLRTKELKNEEIVDILLENRGLKTKKQKEEFLQPSHPEDISLGALEIEDEAVRAAIKRIEKAVKNKEKMIIYGDYDADGVCASAIIWETLYALGADVMPYIPSRFSEGYGINTKSIENLKSQYPNLKLIITVDNGIVANEGVDRANELGIDVIVTDHHQKGKKLPGAFSIIHTDKISGSGIAWILAREVLSNLPVTSYEIQNSLELAAIGTISDQLPLIGPNRSFAKYGLEALNKTERVGFLALFEEAGINLGSIGVYEVNFVITPRINATGRMEHAIDSLRLLCTKSRQKARVLASYLDRTNRERQRAVDEVVLHAREMAQKISWKSAIVLAHESYHEGVIGLAASRLVEEFWRPAIVLSKGERISKASARSIAGFNIIENIRKLDSLIRGGGGHPMAAGFTIESDKIEVFRQKFEEISTPLLTDEILTRRLKIDVEVEFEDLNLELTSRLSSFEPTGVGNPTPVFATNNTTIIDARTVGSDAKHLRLMLEKDLKRLNAIAFGKGDLFLELRPNQKVDVAYSLLKDSWNGTDSLQLRIKDLLIKNGRSF